MDSSSGIKLFLEINVAILWLVALTATTGSFATIIWRCIRKSKRISNNIIVVRRLLFMAIACWIFPLVFAYWLSREGNSIFTYEMFYSNSDEIMLVPFINLIWLVGVIIRVSGYAAQYRMLCRLKADSIRDFESEVQVYGLTKRSVEVYRSEAVRSPMTMGSIRPSIFLPIDCFDSDTLKLILTHEVNHIKHMDAVMKCLLMAITSINWFSRGAKQLFYDVNAYNEFYCDIASIDQLGIDSDEYYSCIRRLKAGKKRMGFSGASTLFENLNTLKDRTRVYDLYAKARRDGSLYSGRSFITIFAAIFAAAVLAFTACYAEVVAYDMFMKLTTSYSFEKHDIFKQQSAAESYTYSARQLNITPIDDAVSEHRTWTIGREQEFRCGSYYLEKGESIWVYTSSDNEVEFGIVRETDRYCLVGRNEGHNFTADRDGFYYVYVKNIADGKTTGQSLVVK